MYYEDTKKIMHTLTTGNLLKSSLHIDEHCDIIRDCGDMTK